jgi:hypothetical protein
MVVLAAVEMIVLVLMALLVAGLLRSHATILRRLEALDPDGSVSGVGTGDATLPADSSRVEPTRPAFADGLPAARVHQDAAAAFDVVGTTLEGDAIKIGVGGGSETLLAFLSSGCLTCDGFWRALGSGAAGSLPAGIRPVVVTKDSSHESPSRLVELAPRDVPVVMSSEAWEAYRVQGSPYFIHVGDDGRVAGEGTATAWDQVRSMLRDAAEDQALARRREARDRRVRAAAARSTLAPRDGGIDRLRRADAELASAGIHPGHPSLYGPNGPPPQAVVVAGPREQDEHDDA